jgi:hypothetical protein
MATNRRTCLIILSASILLLALPGCGGESSPSSEGQDISEVPTETLAHPTATRTPVPPTAEPTEPPAPDWGDSITWLASDPYAASGLELKSGDDFDTEAILAGNPQEPAHRVGGGEVLPSDDGNETEDHFMQFNIDDSFLHAGAPTQSVQFEIEYLDEGTDTFFIEYDGENDQGPFGDGRFTGTAVVMKTDSGEFRTAVLWVNDAFFENRDKWDDFRISDAFDGGGEIIRRVTVTRIMPGSELASTLLVNFHDDGNQLTLGQCTTLHWTVENAVDVTLNGDPVDPQGYDYECPQTTTTYVLLAWNAAEQVQEEITISVQTAVSPNFDLQAWCYFYHESDTGNDFFFFFVSSSQDSLGISGPVTYDKYLGDLNDMVKRGASIPVDPLSPGESSPKVSIHLHDPYADAQCCRIVIRGNSDKYPSNDSYESCR